jgi:hypothetical protein
LKAAFAILAIGFLIYSCKPETKALTAEAYFDVPAFFGREANQLSLSEKRLIKTVGSGQNRDSMRIEKPVWTQEFKLFRKVNLNLPALTGKYTVTADSTDSLHVQFYRLPEGQNGITELIVTQFPNGNTHKLHCRIFETSLLTTHSETWTFVADSGYTYSGYDRINGVSTNNYEITGRIVNAN